MAQQTAVEWLIEQFNLQAYIPHIQQAKQMEKEQIVRAYNSYYTLGEFVDGDYLKGEQYYEQTYGK